MKEVNNQIYMLNCSIENRAKLIRPEFKRIQRIHHNGKKIANSDRRKYSLSSFQNSFTWMASTRYPDKTDTHIVKIASHPIASQ